MESTGAKKIKLALLGATGATGKVIVRLAQKDPRIEELCLVVRKRLEEWKDEEFSCKLKVVEVADFEKLTEALDGQLASYDALISTMGGLSKQGEVMLRNIEYHYPTAFAKSGLA